MTGFLSAVLGALVFYSKSKYFPDDLKSLFSRVPGWAGILPVALTAYLYHRQWGWAVGLLMWLTAVPLAYCCVVFLTQIRSSFAVFFIIVLGVLLSIDLLN